MWTGGSESKDYSTELTKERIDNMKLKQIFGALLSVAVLTTTVAMPQMTVYAVSTFASANEFLEDVIDVALTEIDSSTKDAAVATTMTKFSVADDAVSFNGSVIGYWDSSTSNTLYADAGKTIEIITETANGYEAKPSVLYTILNDVNSNIVENYVPTSSDWSKIIGKYDITLGDITIPAGQWLKAGSIEAEMPVTTGPTSGGINLSTATGLKGEQVGGIYEDDSILYFSWYIDSNGMLYIQDGLSTVYVALQGNPSKLTWYGLSIATNGTESGTSLSSGYYGQKAADYPTLKVHLVPNYGKGIDDTRSSLMTVATMEFLDGSSRIVYYRDTTSASALATIGGLRKYDDSTVLNTEDVTTGKAYGVAYFLGSQCTATSTAELKTEHIGMFNNCTTSKKTIGNQTLTRRLSTLADLSATDTVEIKTNGWTVNGGVDIDQYLGSQSLLNAGDTADIAAVADIDALKFHVIVPTTLPIYVDDANVTYVADNADITNKSGAAVKLTDVKITPVAESGWTMVDTTPSSEIGANEFTFSTTIEKNRVLTISEVYPFEYRAKLSPTTEASTSLELATVMVTVDWAD